MEKERKKEKEKSRHMHTNKAAVSVQGSQIKDKGAGVPSTLVSSSSPSPVREAGKKYKVTSIMSVSLCVCVLFSVKSEITLAIKGNEGQSGVTQATG